MPDYTPKDLHFSSLQEFALTLQQEGVPLSFSQLSKFINTDDIAEQLGITGGKNLRKVPRDAVNVLVNFWPEYVRNRGELPQAAAMLHAFLQKGDALVVADRREIAPVETKEIVPATPAQGVMTQAAPPPMYGYSPTELAAMAVLQGRGLAIAAVSDDRRSSQSLAREYPEVQGSGASPDTAAGRGKWARGSVAAQ